MSLSELDPEWYGSFFEGVTLDLWERACSREQTLSECDLLESLLETSTGARLLDVPCGLGRHLLELASRGYELTGVDLSSEALGRTDIKAKAQGANVELIHGDMRALPAAVPFDGAYCLGNSLGYFDSRGTVDFFKAVSHALKPKAGFLLDTGVAAESILPNLDEKNWVELGDLIFLIENEYRVSESRLDSRFTFVHQGSTQVRQACHYVFTVSELTRMLEEAGLVLRGLFNSTDQEPYSVGDPHLIFFAVKA
jgi:SAM-dependent methyltransferase